MNIPRGGKIELTGILTTKYLRPIILFEDGTYWFAVGLPWGAWNYLEKRVRAEGIRLGWDKIDVVVIEGVSSPNRDEKRA